MATSWKAFSPTTSTGLAHRGALRRLAALAEESRRDEKRIYTFAQIYEEVDPPAPEWLAWVLAEAADRGLVTTVFEAECPSCGQRAWEEAEEPPSTFECSFCGTRFSPAPQDVELLFRFPPSPPPAETPGTEAPVRGWWRRLLTTRFERIAAEAAVGGRGEASGTEARAGRILRSTAGWTFPSTRVRTMGRERRVGALTAVLLVLFVVAFAQWAPNPLPAPAQVVFWSLLCLGLAVIAYCFPGGCIEAFTRKALKRSLGLLGVVAGLLLREAFPLLGSLLPFE